MNSIEDIKPVSFVKANMAEVISQVSETHRPMYITQNGVAKAVMIDTESFEDMKRALSLMKLVAIGEDEHKKGKSIKQGDLFSQIEKKHGWR